MESQPEAGPSKPKSLVLKIRLPPKPPPPPRQSSSEESEAVPPENPSPDVSIPRPKIKLKTSSLVIKNPRRPSVALQTVHVAPRKPPKPKSLTEVLTRILTRIKKKDDFGFFLQPVDPSQVPGYKEAITSPMDFGTMTSKLERRQYQSLEQFNTDFRLVINNAKVFNPPNTVFHREAVKIELFGTDLIAQAAGQVFEPEVAAPSPVVDEPVDDEPDDRDQDASKFEDDDVEMQEPATNQSGQQYRSDPYRAHYTPYYQPKGRGPYRKTILKEEPLVGPGGELPGSKYGVGSYPVGSDIGTVALALEIRGKRYRTKKEKLKIEKEGPPTLSDGSVDYAQLEDPFSVLSHFTPDPFDIPAMQGLKLAGKSAGPVSDFAISVDPQGFSDRIDKIFTSAVKQRNPFFIARGSQASRAAAPDLDGIDMPIDEEPPIRMAGPNDYGVFPILPSRDDSVARISKEEAQYVESLEANGGEAAAIAAHAKDSVDYIRAAAYGGTDGLAYTRSIAEFIDGAKLSGHSLADGEIWEEPDGGLGMPLEEYVRKHVLLPMTAGLHEVLQEAQVEIFSQRHATEAKPVGQPDIPTIASQVQYSVHNVPAHRRRLNDMVQRRQDRIDLTTLIRAPEDLVAKDSVWELAIGDSVKEGALPSALLSTPSNEWIHQSLQSAAKRITNLADKQLDEPKVKVEQNGGGPDYGAGQGDEDPELRALRLNLLALAKFAPLHQIAGSVPTDLLSILGPTQ